MEIKIYATLRQVLGAKSIHVDDAPEISVAQMLKEIYNKYPRLRPELFAGDPSQLNPAIHVLINGRDMRYLDGMESVITPKDEVRLFPPVGGGSL